MASSNHSNLRFSGRTVIAKSSNMDNEGFCSSCFICDKMPSDNLKATHSANLIGSCSNFVQNM
jgi:hypothetical protein